MGKGRPPIPYKKEYCKQLIDHMKKGFSFDSFAAKVPCGRDTLYRWANPKEKYYKPDFCDAEKVGLSLCLEWWEKEGFKGMWGGKKFNPSIWVFMMKNRFGYRDNPKNDEEDGEDKNVTVKIAYDRGNK